MSEEEKFDGVVDRKAHNKYVKLKDQLDNYKGRYVQTSDPQLIVDLVSPKATLSRQMRHISLDEQEGIFQKTEKIRKLLGNMIVEKRKAYGTLNYRGAASDGLGPATMKHTEILEYFGRYFNIGEVHKIVSEEWNYDVSYDAISTFYKKNIERIEELKQQYQLEFSNVRLGQKRSRLDEYTFLYNRIKDKYLEGEIREDAKLLKELLESIKREVDGDLVINAKMQIDVEQTVNVKIQQEMIKNFNITSLVVSNMAAKLDVNPMYLVARLSNSYYAKFTGFRDPDKDRLIDEIPHTSELVYDMSKMAKANKNGSDKYTKFKELTPVKDKSKAQSVKASLLNSLKNGKANIDKTKLNIKKKDGGKK